MTSVNQLRRRAPSLEAASMHLSLIAPISESVNVRSEA